MSETNPNTPFIDVSVCVIAKDTEAEHVRQMIATLPAGVEVVILWNKQGKENYIKQAATQTLRNGTMITTLRYEWDELDFSELRNLCIQRAWRNWILWLDADDRLLPHQHDFFNRLDIYSPGIGALTCGCVGNQPTHDDTKPLEVMRFCAPQPRLFRNGCGFKFEGAAHEQLGWSVNHNGYMIADCSLVIHHVGYETDADSMRNKMMRNVRALAREFLRCEDETKLKFWASLLHRDSQSLNFYLNKE